MKHLGFLLSGMILLMTTGAPLSAQQTYSMNTLTDAAVRSDPDIHRLESGMEVDKAALAGARASALPSISFENSYSYIANPQDAYVLKAGSLGSIPVAPGKSIQLPQSDVTVLDAQDPKAFNFGLNIDQPIFLWGKIKNNIALAEKMVASDVVKVEKQREETATMVAVNLYSLYYLDQIEKLLKEQKGVADDLLRIAEDSLKAGQINDADLIQKRMATNAIAHAIVGASDQRATALRNLRYLTNLRSLTVEQISFDGIDNELSSRSPQSDAELTAQAAKGNKDVKLLQMTQEIRKAKVEISNAGTPLKPDLVLNVQLGYKGSRVPGVESDWDTKDQLYGVVSIAINANIFDGGKARASVRGAEAEQAQAGYQLDATLRQVAKYVSETSYELTVIKQNIDYFTERAKDARDIVAFQKRLLDNGAGSRLEYYQKRVDVFTEETQVLQQKLNYATRYLTLMNVIGSTGTK